MKFKVKFNSKSRSQGILNALSLAESLNSINIENMVIVESNELSDNLKELLSIVAPLSKTEIEIGGIKIDKQGYRISEILYCPKFIRCKGECSVGSYEWEQITFLFNLRKRDDNEEYSLNSFEEYIFDQFGRNILIDFTKNEFTIDRDNLINAYNERFQIAHLLCSKFKRSKYLDAVSNFKSHQTFQIPKVELYDFNESAELESIGKLNEEKKLEQNELIVKIGDEVEKRIKQLLINFMNKVETKN